VDTWAANLQIKPGTFYNMLLAVNGTTATLMLDNKKLFSYVFSPRVVDGYAYNLNTGMVGVGSDNSRGVFDNITVQRIPPPITLQVTEEFTSGDGAFTGLPSGAWQVAGGRYDGVPAAGSDRAVSLATLPDGKSLAVSSLLAIETTLRTAGTGGIVFDYYTPDDFKYVAVNAVTNQVILGHHTKKGWFADAVASRTIGAGVDHKLAVSLKGTTVSVTLDGQAVTGFVYNAAVVDGKFGLFTASGSSSFDSATFRTDDPAFGAPATPSALTASAAPEQPSSGTAPLTYESLGLALPGAVSSLAASTGADPDAISWLSTVAFRITDLPGNMIGMAEGFTISIDSDAAGYGWSAGGMDLRSAVAHEMGHLLGLDHLEDTVMSPTLSAGERLTQRSAQGVREAATYRPETDLLAPSLHGSGWNVSGAGLHDGSEWMVDIATLSAVYGRKVDDALAREEGDRLYADAGGPWDSVPAQFGKEWEIDFGDDGPFGKGKSPWRKGRAL
jgi:hypothetical protein